MIKKNQLLCMEFTNNNLLKYCLKNLVKKFRCRYVGQREIDDINLLLYITSIEFADIKNIVFIINDGYLFVIDSVDNDLLNKINRMIKIKSFL